MISYSNHWKISSIIFCLLSTVCLGSPTPAEQAIFEYNLEELLEVRVSGATKSAKSYLSVPASSNVFDRAALNFMGLEKLRDLIPFAPGFYSPRTDDDRFHTITARGRRIASSGREVLILVDGMRIDNWFSGGGMQTAPDLSLGGMKKVEFIRGAVSQVYGSNAFNGVINMVTDPELRDLSVFIGDNDAYHLRGNIGSEHNEFKHKLYFNLDSEGGQDYEVSPSAQPEPVTMNDGYSAWEGNYQAHLNNWSLLLQGNQSQQKRFYSAGNLQPEFNGIANDFATASLKHGTQLSNDINIVTQLGYNFYDWRVKAESLPAGALAEVSTPSSDAPLRFKVNHNISREAWLSIDTNWQPTTDEEYLANIEWRHRKKDTLYAYSNYDLAALAATDFPIRYFNNFENPTESQPPSARASTGSLPATHSSSGGKSRNHPGFAL